MIDFSNPLTRLLGILSSTSSQSSSADVLSAAMCWKSSNDWYSDAFALVVLLLDSCAYRHGWNAAILNKLADALDSVTV